MRPVIERIAHTVGHRRGPFLEFLPVTCVSTGYIPLVYAVGAHGAPFIVVAFEPYLRKIFKFMVAGHIFGYQVAMVVYDWLAGGILVVEPSRGLGLKQEIFVVERSHFG